MVECKNVKIRKLGNVKMCWYENVIMLKCEDVKMWKSKSSEN